MSAQDAHALKNGTPSPAVPPRASSTLYCAICISFFPRHCHQIPKKGNKGKEGVVPAHGLGVQSITTGKTWWETRRKAWTTGLKGSMDSEAEEMATPFSLFI